MSHKITVELNEGQYDSLRLHAKSRKREPSDDLVAVWWGRMKALDTYAEKLASEGSKFRPYFPKLLPQDEREKLKGAAARAGIVPAPKRKLAPEKQKKAIKEAAAASAAIKAATKVLAAGTKVPGVKKKGRVIKPGKGSAYKIDLYDSESVAKFKANAISRQSGRAVKDILKDAGRNLNGKLVK